MSYLFLLSVFFLGIYKGLTYDKKYSMDLTGYGLTIVMLGGAGLIGWEMITLFDFLIKGTNGDVYLSNTELKIQGKDGQEILKLQEIKSIEFVSPRLGTKSVTSYVEHCKLTFKNKRIILTSFTIKNKEIAKHLNIRLTSTRSRERRYFELIS